MIRRDVVDSTSVHGCIRRSVTLDTAVVDTVNEQNRCVCLENIPAVDVRRQANGGIGSSPEPVYKGPGLRVWSLSEDHVTCV